MRSNQKLVLTAKLTCPYRWITSQISIIISHWGTRAWFHQNMRHLSQGETKNHIKFRNKVLSAPITLKSLQTINLRKKNKSIKLSKNMRKNLKNCNRTLRSTSTRTHTKRSNHLEMTTTLRWSILMIERTIGAPVLIQNMISWRRKIQKLNVLVKSLKESWVIEQMQQMFLLTHVLDKARKDQKLPLSLFNLLLTMMKTTDMVRTTWEVLITRQLRTKDQIILIGQSHPPRGRIREVIMVKRGLDSQAQ